MTDVLPQYDVNSATWFYLSLLLIVAIYFRFTRFWSLRNVDLALLLSFSPALLFLERQPTLGNTWLFAVSGLLLLRLLCDGLFPRRPRMEQNLNTPGLAFLGVCALAFLSVRVASEPLPDSTLSTIERSENVRQRVDTSGERLVAGPTPSLIAAQVGAISEVVSNEDPAGAAGPGNAALVAARVMAILSHLAVVLALFTLGHRLFADPHTGLAMAVLYLLLPCTFYQSGEVIHVLPSALILWALVAWRRPVVSGGLLGLACGTLFFPVFLLPLWASFYGRKNAPRFVGALLAVGLVLLGSLALTSTDPDSFTRQVFGSIDWSALAFRSPHPGGFWSEHNDAYRLPVCVAFGLVLVFTTIWPKKKSLEYLIAASTAIVVATQFWYPQQGSVYLLWYLPLMLVVTFRPKLPQSAPTPLPATQAPAKAETQPPSEAPKLVGTSVHKALFR